MRGSLWIVGLLALLNFAAAPARASDWDDNARTVCDGTRCVGSYCNQDGDATNCWRESVYRRKGKEEVHWACTKHGHRCSWIVGPMPGDEGWNVLTLSTE